ncbi:MAG: FtsX-like permease family protein [Pseudomonadota bacterium]
MSSTWRNGSNFGLSEGPEIVPVEGWSAPLTAMIAAAMGFLAVLTLVAAMAADRLATEWRADLAGVATVRVSAPPDEMDDKVRTVLEVLRTTPGIAEIRVLSQGDQAELLAPWLGTDAGIDDLPLPQLIDVSLDGAGPDAKSLRDRLALTLEGVTYDDHAAWRAPLAATANALERLAIGATVLVLFAAGAMVVLASRATLAANRRVIEVVRLIGAEDRYIASAFVRRLTLRAFIGATLGTLAACLALWLLPVIEADAAFGVALSPDQTGWLRVIIGVPIASGLVAWISARVATRSVLARLP